MKKKKNSNNISTHFNANFEKIIELDWEHYKRIDFGNFNSFF